MEKYHGTDTHLTDALTIEAIAAIDQAIDSQKPFFLNLAHYAVHSPYQMDPRFADHYADADVPVDQQKFATLIEGMDKSLGDLIDHLRRREVGGDTLLFFLGDNGTASPHGDKFGHQPAAPLRGMKGTHYEGGMRVPFIASWVTPDAQSPIQSRLPIAAGEIQSQMANLCDIFPTILELTQTSAPDGHRVDGQSVAGLLTGSPDADHAEEFLMHFPHEHRSSYFTSYRKDNWKIVRHHHPELNDVDGEYQLFDLNDDPFEVKDLAESNPGVLREMIGKLEESLQRHEAQPPRQP